MLSQDHFIGYVTTTLNNTFPNNFETNGAPYKTNAADPRSVLIDLEAIVPSLPLQVLHCRADAVANRADVNLVPRSHSVLH